MVTNRIPETDHGIADENEVRDYDIMQRYLRDKGWIETKDLLKSDITTGHALEVGPGPGYLGLEWLKNTEGTTLTGLDISPTMLALVRKNAADYGMTDRTKYVHDNAMAMQFANETFDNAFTNGSLHEWAEPVNVFDEIWRVLKPGGRFFISDLRRDMNFIVRWFLRNNTNPKSMADGLDSSLNASYTPNELRKLIKQSKLSNGEVKANFFGLQIIGRKDS